jgi:anti-sigma factor RsiW
MMVTVCPGFSPSASAAGPVASGFLADARGSPDFAGRRRARVRAHHRHRLATIGLVDEQDPSGEHGDTKSEHARDRARDDPHRDDEALLLFLLLLSERLREIVGRL